MSFTSNNPNNNNKADEGLTFDERDENASRVSRVKIDQCKVFENFMKCSNLPVVAALYEKSCKKNSYRRRMRTSIFSKPGSFIPNMVRRQNKQEDKIM
jgi:hypothetical protein